MPNEEPKITKKTPAAAAAVNRTKIRLKCDCQVTLLATSTLALVKAGETAEAVPQVAEHLVQLGFAEWV